MSFVRLPQIALLLLTTTGVACDKPPRARAAAAIPPPSLPAFDAANDEAKARANADRVLADLQRAVAAGEADPILS